MHSVLQERSKSKCLSHGPVTLSFVNILTRQPHMHSVLQERSKSKCLSHGPVTLSFVNHLIPCLQNPFHCSVDLEVRSIRRSLGKSSSDMHKSLLVYSSISNLQWVFAFKET